MKKFKENFVRFQKCHYFGRQFFIFFFNFRRPIQMNLDRPDLLSFFFEFCSAVTNDIRSTRSFVILSAFTSDYNIFRPFVIFYDFTSEFRNDFTSLRLYGSTLRLDFTARRVVNFSDFWSVLKMNFSRPDVMSFFFEFSSAYKNEFRPAGGFVIFYWILVGRKMTLGRPTFCHFFQKINELTYLSFPYKNLWRNVIL
jgi:hypothetical protein